MLLLFSKMKFNYPAAIAMSSSSNMDDRGASWNNAVSDAFSYYCFVPFIYTPYFNNTILAIYSLRGVNGDSLLDIDMAILRVSALVAH